MAMIDRYFEVIRDCQGARAERRIRYQMGFLYRGIDFKGKRVLDIGGGRGEHALFAAACGAKFVLNLEPEADGSRIGVGDTFKAMRDGVGVLGAEIESTRLQEYDEHENSFDIVLLQDAINHLNEAACITLKSSQVSRSLYLAMFQKLARLCTSGCEIIISDCSSENLFPALGLPNPFDPGIEWIKHQPPSVWIDLLRQVGFTSWTLRWSSPSILGRFGQVLFGNACCSYFFTSHFAVRMKYLCKRGA